MTRGNAWRLAGLACLLALVCVAGEAVAEPLRVAPEEPVCELDADTVNVAVTVVEGVVKAVFVAVCVPVMLPTSSTN